MMSDNDTLNDAVTKKTNATEDLTISNINDHAPAADNEKSKSLDLDDGSDVSGLGLSSELLGSARNTLFASVFLLLGDVMGTGVLSLPHSASTIGFFLTIFALFVFAFAAYYSGFLLSAVKQKYPGINSYKDAACALNGRTFGMFTEICILLNWGALLIYFVISTSSSLALITDQYEGVLDCQWQKTLVACFLLLIPVQCRDYHTISFLAVPSTIAIVVVVVLILENISTQGKQFGVDTAAGPDPDSSFTEVFSSFSSFVFAYQGQSIYFELSK
jgi:amino acid permease